MQGACQDTVADSEGHVETQNALWLLGSGSQSFKPQRFEGGGMRLLRFKRWLTDIKPSTARHGPTWLVMPTRPFMLGVNS